MSCRNGKANLADGQEVWIFHEVKPFDVFIFHPQVTIETPNFPENYPNKAKCNWKIKVPAGEEVHIWCETFDLLKGDFLRVSIKNFGFAILTHWFQVKGVTEKLYGTFADGIGEIFPATSDARTLRVQFRSNKRKNAGGFRCQVSLQSYGFPASSMTYSGCCFCSNHRDRVWFRTCD